MVGSLEVQMLGYHHAETIRDTEKCTIFDVLCTALRYEVRF